MAEYLFTCNVNMDYLVFALFLIFALGGLISIIFGLPGTIIILIDAIVYGWYGGFKEITVKVIVILAFLAVLSEALEYILGVIGAKRYGSSRRAIVASFIVGFIGAILGAPFLFGIGSIIGALLGAFIGAFLAEYFKDRGTKQALRSGMGVFTGRVVGTVMKGVIGLVMVVTSLVVIAGN